MHLIRTHADRSHLQVKLDCHLLLQFREVLSATYISAARALSPGAHHVVHRSSRHRRKKCRHSCGVVAIDAADAHAGGVGRTDLSASGLELLGVAADNPGDTAAVIHMSDGSSDKGVQRDVGHRNGRGALQLEYCLCGSFAHAAATPKDQNCHATQCHFVGASIA